MKCQTLFTGAPSAGAICYGENNNAIHCGRGQAQEADFQGNLVNITGQYQGGRSVSLPLFLHPSLPLLPSPSP